MVYTLEKIVNYIWREVTMCGIYFISYSFFFLNAIQGDDLATPIAWSTEIEGSKWPRKLLSKVLTFGRHLRIQYKKDTFWKNKLWPFILIWFLQNMNSLPHYVSVFTVMAHCRPLFIYFRLISTLTISAKKHNNFDR